MPGPIDPLEGPRFVLKGRVVTMDPERRVIARGAVYVEKGSIVAVRDSGESGPDGFKDAPKLDTRGTIYPGLIELHNHLSYNLLPLWLVPQQFAAREEWGSSAEYDRLVKAPMKVIGREVRLLPALVRYVECKCLLGGVTTSQGIRLNSAQGISRYYRGYVRNVEQTGESVLPEAATRIPDVAASSWTEFKAALDRASCLLLHLAEGIGEKARRHFLALENKTTGQWALGPALAGIHAAALTAEDFGRLGAAGGAIVWSPLSNLLLYGGTADVKAARQAGVRVGIGSDWSPSGSKNLLGELKVARVWSRLHGGFLSDADIVAMATSDAAAILKWDELLGSVEAGKRADLVVVAGKAKDAYGQLLEAKETDLRLVVINGVPRFGTASLMGRLNARGERVAVGGRERWLFLEQQTADEDVRQVSLASAREMLADALERIRELAQAAFMPRALRAEVGPGWRLALDELEETDVEMRPRLEFGAAGPTGFARPLLAAGPVQPADLPERIRLDPLTVADDSEFLPLLSRQTNLATEFQRALVAALD